ncbi:hypothetical protein ACFYWP_30750 [Actinacidiphila glaucinigra]|uniref:hypothetical protein n=1 Tax=Actinacidiphila glaucinigra TaxID=235986 RepID=UPI0036739357
MYTHELLGREKAEQLLREAARYRLARQAREAARAAGRRATAAGHDEGRRHARRAGRLIRRLRAAG